MKNVLFALFAAAVFAAGCSRQEVAAPEPPTAVADETSPAYDADITAVEAGADQGEDSEAVPAEDAVPQ